MRVLYPTPATSIPRDLLEPLPKGAFSIGEIGQYDKYKTIHTSFSIDFDDSVDKTAETDEERKHDMQPCSRSGVNIWMIQKGC